MTNNYKPITNLNILLQLDNDELPNYVLMQLNILKSMKHINILSIFCNDNYMLLNDDNIINNDILHEYIIKSDFNINIYGDWSNTVLICKRENSNNVIGNIKTKVLDSDVSKIDNMAIIEYDNYDTLELIIYGMQTCFRVNNSYKDTSNYDKLYKNKVVLACGIQYTDTSKNKYVISLINNIINNSFKPKNIRSLPINIINKPAIIKRHPTKNPQTAGGITSKIKNLFSKGNRKLTNKYHHKPPNSSTSSKKRHYNNNFNNTYNYVLKILVKENKYYERENNYNIIFKYNNIFGLTIIDFILFTDVGNPAKDTVNRYTKSNKKYKYKKTGKFININTKSKRITNIINSYNNNKKTINQSHNNTSIKHYIKYINNINQIINKYNIQWTTIIKSHGNFIYDKIKNMYLDLILKNNAVEINLKTDNKYKSIDDYLHVYNIKYKYLCMIKKLLFHYLNKNILKVNKEIRRYNKTHDNNFEEIDILIDEYANNTLFNNCNKYYKYKEYKPSISMKLNFKKSSHKPSTNQTSTPTPTPIPPRSEDSLTKSIQLTPPTPTQSQLNNLPQTQHINSNQPLGTTPNTRLTHILPVNNISRSNKLCMQNKKNNYNASTCCHPDHNCKYCKTILDELKCKHLVKNKSLLPSNTTNQTKSITTRSTSNTNNITKSSSKTTRIQDTNSSNSNSVRNNSTNA